MTLNKREKMLVGVTISVVVIGGHYLLVSPLSKRWDDLNNRLRTKTQELELQKATLERQPQWKKDYDELRAKVGAQTSDQFRQTSDVIKKIQEVAGNTGIMISNIRPLSTAEKGVYRELPVQCAFEANTDSLVKFLHGLQTSSGFMSVEELRVSGKPDNPSVLRCDIQVRALAGKSAEGSGT
jgi:Tfp pilus assembly protein PilO